MYVRLTIELPIDMPQVRDSRFCHGTILEPVIQTTVLSFLYMQLSRMMQVRCLGEICLIECLVTSCVGYKNDTQAVKLGFVRV